jgi:hypothetical protein
MAEAFAECRALALVVRLIEDTDFVAFDRPQDFARAVGATVIDNDDFLRDWHGLDAPEYFPDRLLLVVHRHRDRQLEPFRDRVDAQLPAGPFAKEALQ